MCHNFTTAKVVTVSLSDNNLPRNYNSQLQLSNTAVTMKHSVGIGHQFWYSQKSLVGWHDRSNSTQDKCYCDDFAEARKTLIVTSLSVHCRDMAKHRNDILVDFEIFAFLSSLKKGTGV